MYEDHSFRMTIRFHPGHSYIRYDRRKESWRFFAFEIMISTWGSLHVFSVMRMPGIVGLVLEMLSRMKCCEREIFTLNSFWRDFPPLFFFIRIRVKLLGIVKNFPSRSCLNYGNRNESLCESRMTGKGNNTRGIFRAFNCDPVWTRNSLTANSCCAIGKCVTHAKTPFFCPYDVSAGNN